MVLGVGGARDFWDPSEQEFHTPLEIPEPKTRAAKQKVLEQESGVQISTDPLLTLVSRSYVRFFYIMSAIFKYLYKFVSARFSYPVSVLLLTIFFLI